MQWYDHTKGGGEVKHHPGYAAPSRLIPVRSTKKVRYDWSTTFNGHPPYPTLGWDGDFMQKPPRYIRASARRVL